MSDMADPPAVMTIPEVAAVLRISRGSAYEAARSGEIPTVRLGRTLRVPRGALELMLGASTLSTINRTDDTEGGETPASSVHP